LVQILEMMLKTQIYHIQCPRVFIDIDVTRIDSKSNIPLERYTMMDIKDYEVSAVIRHEHFTSAERDGE